jgi:hypothetical protein
VRWALVRLIIQQPRSISAPIFNVTELRGVA